MEVVLKGQTIQLSITTITIQPNKGLELYAFHCSSCGNVVSQIQGSVTKIYPIHEPDDDVAVVSLCNKCKRRYTFQTYGGYNPDKIKVVLHPNGSDEYFYCYLGKGTPLLRYSSERIYSIADRVMKEIPFTQKCMDSECPIEYHFVDLV